MTAEPTETSPLLAQKTSALNATLAIEIVNIYITKLESMSNATNQSAAYCWNICAIICCCLESRDNLAQRAVMDNETKKQINIYKQDLILFANYLNDNRNASFDDMRTYLETEKKANITGTPQQMEPSHIEKILLATLILFQSACTGKKELGDSNTMDTYGPHSTSVQIFFNYNKEDIDEVKGNLNILAAKHGLSLNL